MVASAEFDPIVVEAQLTAEKVDELLARKRESAKLDYKREWDPQKNRDVLELTKDLVAMANTAGGYVVIGMGDGGEETGLSEGQANRLDEATLRAQVQTFIGTPLELFLDKTVVWQSKRYAVVTVLKCPRSPVVFEKIGQYAESGAGGKNVTVFRDGDVFVRHGSASERWSQEDVRVIYARVVEREKERWLAEVLPDVRRLIEGAGAGAPVSPSPQELLRSDAETFERFLRRIVRGPK
jgi:predicted HTH transcriptional regulator